MPKIFKHRWISVSCCLLIALFSAAGAYAQTKTIKGKVVDELNQPVIGATVKVQNMSTGTVTDINGDYSIQASPKDVILFSFVGYDAKKEVVGRRSVINVELKEASIQMSDVVVIGYGTQKKANLTGAVASVNVEAAINSRPVTDIGRALQGAVPGLSVTTTTGAIGTTPTITLRGVTGSLSSSATPLILLDNVPIPDLNFVNPDDIESISVLKDAASSAIYGARAAFGVVLLTSKTAKKNDRLKVNYSTNFAWATPGKVQHMALAWQSAQAYLTAARHDSPQTEYVGTVGGLRYNDEIIQKMKDWSALYGRGEGLSREMERGRDFEIYKGYIEAYRDWDVQKLFFSKWTPQTTHNLSLSGGSKSTTYGISLGNLNQTGVFKSKPDSYDRYNVGINVSSDINKYLSLRARTQLTMTRQKSPFSLSGGTYTPLFTLFRFQPSYLYGTYKGLPFRSPVNEYEQAEYQREKEWYNRYSLGATVTPFKGLAVDVDYTYSTNFYVLNTIGGIPSALDIYTSPTAENAADPTTMYKAYTNLYDYVSASTTRTEGHVLNATVAYDKKFKGHSLKIMGGTNIEATEVFYHWSQRKGVVNYDYPEIPLATGDQFVSASHSKSALAGFFGRVNYAFKDRYLLELNGRYDGTSKFTGQNQWGFFPSVSGAYRLTEEPFMAFVKKYVDSFKIRGSWGSIGNQRVASGQFISLMGIGQSSWLIKNKKANYASVPTLLNKDLTWETVQTIDLGFDGRFLNDQLGITFDVYQRMTYDMLSPGQAYPSSLGAVSPNVNYGELRTRGFELTIDFNHTFANGLHIGLVGNLQDYKTVITKYASAVDPLITSYHKGYVIGDVWGYQTDRLFQKDDFDLNPTTNKYVLKPGIPSQSILESSTFTFGPGDVKYVDLNGDGKIDYGTNTVSNHGDKKVIGNVQPRYQFSLRLSADWKGFDVEAFFQGIGKRKYWATGNTAIPGWDAQEAWYDYQMDYWTEDNTNAFYPRPKQMAQAGSLWNFQPQSRYILNMAYCRMKSLVLGYTLPSKLMRKIDVRKFRVYVSGENLFEFDAMKIPIDPETGLHSAADARMFGRGYPYRRTISVGAQITL